MKRHTDMRWDFIQSFIDFGEARDPQVQEAAIRKYRHPNVKYGDFANSAEELVSSTDTPHLTVNDAVRSDYDQLARDHALGLPDQQQKLLNIALAEEEKQHLFSLLPAVRLGLCSKTCGAGGSCWTGRRRMAGCHRRRSELSHKVPSVRDGYEGDVYSSHGLRKFAYSFVDCSCQ